MLELFQKDVAGALALVLDLAQQNVIEDDEMADEAAEQEKAIETVQEYLNLLNDGTDLTQAAVALEELAGVDVDTFMDRVENGNDDYLGWWKPLYEKMARLIEAAKQPRILEVPLQGHVVRLYPSGDGAPNNKPVLKVFKLVEGERVPLASIELSDYASMAQYFHEEDMIENLGLDRDSRQFKSRVKATRKALGYSQP